MYKKSLLLSLLISSGSLLYSAAEKGQNWLILGGGGDRAAAYFDTFFKGTPIRWQSFDLEQCGVNCIKGDFNKFEDLKALPDNHYSVILFDVSTVGWLKWSKEHIRIIKEKLTDPGILLIPDERHMTFSDQTGATEKESLSPESISEYYKRFKLGEPKDLFFHGGNIAFYKPAHLTSDEYSKKLPTSRLMFLVTMPNRRTLELMLGQGKHVAPSSLDLIPKLIYPVYSHGPVPSRFYIGLKSSKPESIEDAFSKLITIPLKK